MSSRPGRCLASCCEGLARYHEPWRTKTLASLEHEQVDFGRPASGAWRARPGPGVVFYQSASWRVIIRPVTDPSLLTRVLEHNPSVTLAVLFGSAARGADGPANDVDVGVLFASDAARHECATALGVALERSCGRTVDLVTLNDAPPLLRFEIARTAVLLVERSQHAWSDFRVRAAVDWWDWAPTARRMYAAAAARVRARAGSWSPETSSPVHVQEGRDGTA